MMKQMASQPTLFHQWSTIVDSYLRGMFGLTLLFFSISLVNLISYFICDLFLFITQTMMYECHEELAANKEDYTFGMEILEFV